MILNMFRGSLCSYSGGRLYLYSMLYRRTCLCMLPSSAPIKSGLQAVLLKMSTAMLETC
jgi:hypothetical protein